LKDLLSYLPFLKSCFSKTLEKIDNKNVGVFSQTQNYQTYRSQNDTAKNTIKFERKTR